MVLGEAMIAAGIGCRSGASAAEVTAALEAALQAHALERAAVSVLATVRQKQFENGIIIAGGALNLPVILVDADGIDDVSDRVLSHSAKSMAIAGTPSVSEAAALAAAGQGSRLLGPRIAVGPVTCALAIGGDGA
jgi:cobalt-precorrin 5A hydrolase